MNLSVCIIAKNEETHLRRCLRCLAPLSCEIILADTGSTDKTPAIAAEFTEKVYHFPWTDDFSAARNFAAEKAKNDWILAVDCDEFLEMADQTKLQDFMYEHPDQIGVISIRNPYRMYGEELIHLEHIARLYDRRRYIFRGKVHETLSPVSESMETSYRDIPLTFYHAGYLDENTRRIKAERNLQLLRRQLEEDGPDPYVYYQIGQCCTILGDSSLAAESFDKGLSMEINPDLSYVRDMIVAYGYALTDLKQYQKALGLAALYDSQAVSADYLFLMGLIYMNNAMFDDAVREFKRALQTPVYNVEGVNSYRARYNIGVIYEVTGRIAEAVEWYRDCGEYAPARARISALSAQET